MARNAGDRDETFLHAIEGVSLPVFVLFFTLAGASLDIPALRVMGPPAILIVAARTGAMFGGGWIGGRLSGEPPLRRPLYGLTFLAQAGVKDAVGAAREWMGKFIK